MAHSLGDLRLAGEAENARGGGSRWGAEPCHPSALNADQKAAICRASPGGSV